MPGLVHAAAEGNPKVFIAFAVGLLIVLAAGPVSRLLGRSERSMSRTPESALTPLLNRERQDAMHQWRRSGGGAEPARYLLVFGGLLFMALSVLLYLGVID